MYGSVHVISMWEWKFGDNKFFKFGGKKLGKWTFGSILWKMEICGSQMTANGNREILMHTRYNHVIVCTVLHFGMLIVYNIKT